MYIVSGFDCDEVVRNSLINLYGKCGALVDARKSFEDITEHNIVAWNAMMVTYSLNGNGEDALLLLEQMWENKLKPDSFTFVSVLTACNHAGLIEEGQIIFDDMHSIYDLAPTLEHYACMVDLFGRAGHFDKVKTLLYKASHSGHLPVFRSILGSCRKWRNVKLGRWAFEQSIQIDEKCSVAYVCMEKIYAAVGMQTEADGIEALRVKNKAWKIPGQFLGAEALI